MKSGSLNLLETSGPRRACNGTALSLPLPLLFYDRKTNFTDVFLVAARVRKNSLHFLQNCFIWQFEIGL
jgi:hypothetical protein